MRPSCPIADHVFPRRVLVAVMAGIVHQPVPTMASPQMINLATLIDDAKCYELIRHCRWPEGVCCTACSSTTVICHGHDETQRHRQRYQCQDCGTRFDDLTGTILAGHHQPLRAWVLCLYFMGLNLSNQQIAKELSLNDDDVHNMASFAASILPPPAFGRSGRFAKPLPRPRYRLAAPDVRRHHPCGCCRPNLRRCAHGSLLLRRFPKQPGRYEPQRGEESG